METDPMGTVPGPNRPDPAMRLEDPGVSGGGPAGRVCVCGAAETAIRHIDPASITYHDFVPQGEARDIQE